MSEYNFLKTGSGSMSESECNEDFIKNMMSIYMVFAEDAMRIAGNFTTHLNGTVVTEENIAKAMKIRAINGDMFWNQPNTQARLDEMKNALSGDYDSSENEETYAETETIVNNCNNCEMCVIFDTIDSKWETWVPHTEQELSLKKAIDNAASKF